ncbi:MAG: rhodanese-like domain-containing protein [Gammaproteobacteria bacterium]
MFGIREIDSQELAQRLQDKPDSIRLVDVRTPGEINQGVIPGARSTPLHLLPLKADELADDTDIVFYCRTGARSAQACAFLASRGYTRVWNLRGGIVDWARSGLPIGSPAEAALAG